MADFSLTTVVVVPQSQTVPVTAGSTQDLLAGEVGFFGKSYNVLTAGTIAAEPYFYIAQGRDNTYLQGSKRSDKINKNRVTEWYTVQGCPTPTNQIIDISAWTVQCGEVVTLTLRGHSSLLDTLYFNGFTRSVTVQAPCCDCGDAADPCENVDVPALIDSIIEKLMEKTSAINSDNIAISDFYTFERVGDDADAILRIEGKPVTKEGQPCDVAAYPQEYDRLWFAAFVYEGPATTADFIVHDSCNLVASATTTQTSNYATGTSEEIAQLEKNYYSYQAGYLKHLFRTAGYNQNFEGHVVDGVSYDTFYVKFNDNAMDGQNWNANLAMDSMVIFAVPTDNSAAFKAVLVAALGTADYDNACITTTTTASVIPD